MATYTFRKRAFLNSVSTNQTSYILAHVQDSDDGAAKWGGNLIILADCYRAVEFEFCLGSKQHRRMSLKKIDLLVNVLTAFRDALAKEIALIEKSK